MAAGAFVATIGVLSIFLQPSSNEATRSPRTNPYYLAELLRRGPFTEQLGAPLIPDGLAAVRIADASSAKKLTAVQLKIRVDHNGPNDPWSELQIFAHIESYATEQDARERGEASKDFLTRRYETGIERANAESFCIHGDAFWTCAGVRGFVYAEVTLSPNPNANLPIATDTLSALLRYGDRMTQLATS